MSTALKEIYGAHHTDTEYDTTFKRQPTVSTNI
jgi:hypothetical protein